MFKSLAFNQYCLMTINSCMKFIGWIKDNMSQSHNRCRPTPLFGKFPFWLLEEFLQFEYSFNSSRYYLIILLCHVEWLCNEKEGKYNIDECRYVIRLCTLETLHGNEFTTGRLPTPGVNSLYTPYHTRKFNRLLYFYFTWLYNSISNVEIIEVTIIEAKCILYLVSHHFFDLVTTYQLIF